MPPPPSLPSAPSSGLWTCRLPPPDWRVETWAPDTPGSPAVPRSRAPSGSGICSTWSLPAYPSSSPPASSLGLPSPPHSPVLRWPLSVYWGDGGRGRPLFGQGRWDGGGALSFLLFIALGLWGGFPWPPPLPQGRGRSPGESQAWGGSPRVRRGGGRSPVTEVPGPGPSAGICDPLPNAKPGPSQDTSPPALAALTGAYLGAGASRGHRERGGLILGVLQRVSWGGRWEQ